MQYCVDAAWFCGRQNRDRAGLDLLYIIVVWHADLLYRSGGQDVVIRSFPANGAVDGAALAGNDEHQFVTGELQ